MRTMIAALIVFVAVCAAAQQPPSPGSGGVADKAGAPLTEQEFRELQAKLRAEAQAAADRLARERARQSSHGPQPPKDYTLIAPPGFGPSPTPNR